MFTCSSQNPPSSYSYIALSLDILLREENSSVFLLIACRLPDPESAPGEVVFGESSSSSSNIEPSPGMGFTNIACAIDPTYQRRVMRGELAPSPQATLQSSSSSSTTSSGTGGLVGASVNSPISPLPPPGMSPLLVSHVVSTYTLVEGVVALMVTLLSVMDFQICFHPFNI